MADDRSFTVESPSRVRLGPEAKWWADQHRMSYTDMARFLLQQHAESGQGFESDDLPPGTTVETYTPEEQEERLFYAPFE